MSLILPFNSWEAIIVMLLLVAVDHFRRVDGKLVVRDRTQLRRWMLRISGSVEFWTKIYHIYYLVWPVCLIAGRSLAGDRT